MNILDTARRDTLSLEFISPSGEILVEPNLLMLKNLIFNNDEDYWNIGSGQGSLNLNNGKNQCIFSLAITFEKSQGFCLEYFDVNDKQDTYISLRSDNFEHKNAVTVCICGDPLLLPTKWFVKPEAAWFAIQEFYDTGKMTTKISWGGKGEQGWDYGEPEGWL